MVPLGGLAVHQDLGKHATFWVWETAWAMGAGGAAGTGCSSIGEIFGKKENEWDVGACHNKTW